jgi:hypothetical protein
MSIQFDRLLSVDSAKAEKAIKYGFLNGIHYMAPASTSGANLCPNATPGCIALCLGKYSGQAGMVSDQENGTNSVRESRIAKARMFMRDRETYLRHLEHQIARLVAKAAKAGLVPCVRLNGSTDISFERMTYLGADGQRLTLLARFPGVQFVDYTKIASRMDKAPANLSLTFSRAENNEAECLELLAKGHNVAIVFAHGLPVSRAWHGYRVIDGDRHDLRHLDPKGCVVGLSPKGRKAKADMSGFVLRDYAACDGSVTQSPIIRQAA